jgi:hypothetical protein
MSRNTGFDAHVTQDATVVTINGTPYPVDQRVGLYIIDLKKKVSDQKLRLAQLESLPPPPAEMACPQCNGDKFVYLHQHGGRTLKQKPCPFCNACGTVSPAKARTFVPIQFRIKMKECEDDYED